jgi:hypothetical protein
LKRVNREFAGSFQEVADSCRKLQIVAGSYRRLNFETVFNLLQLPATSCNSATICKLPANFYEENGG